jgi:hypothetical protein
LGRLATVQRWAGGVCDVGTVMSVF